jgi:uncharacterized glyoxalase superfamily protein PhnB
MNIPEQYNQLMPYLILKGTDGFRKFMEKVFEAKEQLIVPGKGGTVMHGELRIGEAVMVKQANSLR